MKTTNSKKGITIVELLVAMAIFSIVMTLAVGSFVTVSRMQALTNSMKNTQQKLRVTMEMITRLSRQADAAKLSTDGTGKTLELYFDLGSTNLPTASKFRIAPDGLYYSECDPAKIDKVAKTCTPIWGAETELLLTKDSGQQLDPVSKFTKSGSIPPVLTVVLKTVVSSGNNFYYTDSIDITDDVVLEQIK